MEKVIIDTDVLIDVGKGVNEAIDYLKALSRRYKLTMSMMTQMELLIGCRNKKELKKVEKFIERFEIINFENIISQTKAHFINKNEKKYSSNHGLLLVNSLIASTAITLDIFLVTKNQKDYKFIENLKLLPYPNLVFP